MTQHHITKDTNFQAPEYNYDSTKVQGEHKNTP